jgi:hypothetical protein
MRYKQRKCGGNLLVMKGTLLDRPKLFRPSVTWLCSGVTETSHVELTAHALQEMLIWLKLVCNEGHFTGEAGQVFHPCFASHCTGVAETSKWRLQRMRYK